MYRASSLLGCSPRCNGYARSVFCSKPNLHDVRKLNKIIIEDRENGLPYVHATTSALRYEETVANRSETSKAGPEQVISQAHSSTGNDTPPMDAEGILNTLPTLTIAGPVAYPPSVPDAFVNDESKTQRRFRMLVSFVLLFLAGWKSVSYSISCSKVSEPPARCSCTSLLLPIFELTAYIQWRLNRSNDPVY